MGISKRLLVKIVIVFLVGSAAVYGFVQYISLTNKGQYSYKGPVTGERIEIQSVSANATTSTITLYAQSATDSGPVILDSAIIKDTQSSVIGVIGAASIDDNDANTTVDVPTVDVELTRLDITANVGTMVPGESYTVTLVSQMGMPFVSSSFNAVGVTS